MITAEITAASAPVIELGPGTGVFTRQLLARGIPEERLALVEYGSAFIQLLAYQFTYGLSCPVPRVVLDRLGLESARIGRAFVNVPPAAVYRIRRRTRED
jgi:phospholipid N-methyltransferase